MPRRTYGTCFKPTTHFWCLSNPSYSGRLPVWLICPRFLFSLNHICGELGTTPGHCSRCNQPDDRDTSRPVNNSKKSQTSQLIWGSWLGHPDDHLIKILMVFLNPSFGLVWTLAPMAPIGISGLHTCRTKYCHKSRVVLIFAPWGALTEWLRPPAAPRE